MPCKCAVALLLLAVASFTGPEPVRCALVPQECVRNCDAFSEGKCIFKLSIAKSRLDGRLSINGSRPGPLLAVCRGDTVIVEVSNKVGGQEFGVHFRGLDAASPIYDGVPMITQCPIISYTTFTYQLQANRAGTHLYHAHLVSQHAVGLFGPIVVREEYNIYDEHLLLFYPKTKSHSSSLNLDEIEVEKIVIANNSREISNEFHVESGKTYKFRFINGAAYECSLTIELDYHAMTVIASNGYGIQDTRTTSIQLAAGERADALISMDQKGGKYSIRVHGMHHCEGKAGDGTVIYDVRKDTFSTYEEEILKNVMIFTPTNQLQLKRVLSEKDCKEMFESTICAKSTSPTKQWLEKISFKLTIPFGEKQFDNITDADNTYEYVSDVLPVPPFYPSFFATNVFPVMVWQMKGYTFNYPPSPILTQPENFPPWMDCNRESAEDICLNAKSNFCYCFNVEVAPINSTFDLILKNFGGSALESRTFHLHGLALKVLEVKSSGSKFKQSADLAAFKDSVTIPPKGSATVRIHADKPGYWMLESRDLGVKHMEMVFQIGRDEEMPKAPKHLPKCGNMRGPDLVLQ